MRTLLGIDEGTTGVKAALFDERLGPLREACRDKANRHPRPGWVEQDGEEVLAWDAESGAPLTPIVVWQDRRSQEVLDGLGEREEEVRELSGLPFDPYFSAPKLAWLLERDDGV